MLDGRPQRQLVSPAASAAQAAAVIAAVEQFVRDTAPAPAHPPETASPWLRAALLEGTGREPDVPSPWGDTHPWG